MKRQRSSESLPEIAILDRHHRAVVFPLPVVFTPVLQAVGQATADVFAGGDERNARRLLECLEPTNDGQEFQSFAANFGLGVFDFELLSSVDALQYESPIALAPTRLGVGEQQKMRRRNAHTLPRLGGGAADFVWGEGRLSRAVMAFRRRHDNRANELIGRQFAFSLVLLD